MIRTSQSCRSTFTTIGSRKSLKPTRSRSWGRGMRVQPCQTVSISITHRTNVYSDLETRRKWLTKYILGSFKPDPNLSLKDQVIQELQVHYMWRKVFPSLFSVQWLIPHTRLMMRQWFVNFCMDIFYLIDCPKVIVCLSIKSFFSRVVHLRKGSKSDTGREALRSRVQAIT